MASISIEHLTHAYRTRKAVVHTLREFSIDIADRELVVLVGPSGCGKTTALRLIAGLEEPSSGTIRIDGKVVNRAAPKDRDVAMVFQNYALYPHMTVFNNMAFGLKMRGTPKGEIKAKVGAAAERLGLVRLLDRKPSQLSGGEKQRVAVGRAIVRNPKVFLFDEPLSNLDASFRGGLRTEIRALQRELQTTMIYVTHDQEEAMTLGDRLAVMKDGLLHQFGSPFDVYNRPADRFVAGFIGSPSMNFFPGRIESQSGSASFVGDIGRLLLPEAANSLTNLAGQDVILGVRPQDIRLDDKETDGRSKSVAGVVRVVEPLGDRINVHVSCGERSVVIVRASSDRTFSVGGRVRLGIDLQAAHFFADDDFGRRLQ